MYAEMVTAGIKLVSAAGTCTSTGRRPTGKCYGGFIPQSGDWGDCIAGLYQKVFLYFKKSYFPFYFFFKIPYFFLISLKVTYLFTKLY